MTVDPVGVLDTNTLVLIDRVDPETLPEEPVITAVTLAELSVGPVVAASNAERVARQARLQQTEASFEPLPFDAQSAGSFGWRCRLIATVVRPGDGSTGLRFDDRGNRD